MDCILVVDDSPLIQSMMKRFVGRMSGCELRFASNGIEALDTIGRFGEPTLMLLDINMPVMDGLELMGELKGAGVLERTKVIIVSTEGDDEDVLRGLEAGAKAYLRKPFTPDQLQDIIRRVWDA